VCEGEICINMCRADVSDIRLDGVQLDVFNASEPHDPLKECDLGCREDGTIHIAELGVEMHKIKEGLLLSCVD